LSEEVTSLGEVLENMKKKKAEEKGLQPSEVQIRERVHLEKFDGGRDDIAAGLEPSETLIIESGKGIVEHYKKEGS